MNSKKNSIYFIATKGIKIWGILVIVIEIITYTFSFLLSGLIKKDVFNVLEGQKVTLGITSLKILIILNIVVPLLINLVKQINSGLVAKLNVVLNQNVKRKLMENIINIPLCSKKNVSEGDMISLFRNECEDISDYLLEFYYQLPKLTLSVAILGVMFYINPIFAVVSLIPTITMLAFIRKASRRIVMYRESVREATSELTSFLNNFYGNYEYFKVIGNKENVYETFQKKCTKRSKNEIRDSVFDRILNVFSENSANMTLGLVLLIAIPFFLTGHFTVGEFVMFEYYYAFLASMPDALGNIVKRRKQTEVSIYRLQLVGAEIQKVDERYAHYENNRLNVTVSYCGKSLNIDAKKGEIVLILDRDEQDGNELLQCLFEICKENIVDVNCKYIPKIPILFDETIQDNICMGEAYNAQKFQEVLEKTDLKEDIKDFKDGIMKKVGKKGTAISGGQRKRISIARALYLEADILFVDGFSEQVDKNTENKMIKRILNKFNGIVFIVSNSEKMLQIADKIVRI